MQGTRNACVSFEETECELGVFHVQMTGTWGRETATHLKTGCWIEAAVDAGGRGVA